LPGVFVNSKFIPRSLLDTPAAEIARLKPKGLVLSGGPAVFYDKGATISIREFFHSASSARHLLRLDADGTSPGGRVMFTGDAMRRDVAHR
jgi:hypothetical protein